MAHSIMDGSVGTGEQRVKLDRTLTILLVGVGGQGTILAGNILAMTAAEAGLDVKVSEIHGMSQRGGRVESHVRFSPDGQVHSPTIPFGEVDVLMGFELLESLRAIPNTKPGALVLVEDRVIVPSSVTCGPFEYPADMLDQLRASGRNVRVVDAFKIACSLGEPRAANIVLLGAASSSLVIDAQAWEGAIRRTVKAKALDVNLQAFEAGVAAGRAG